jgi:hypothetical protein
MTSPGMATANAFCREPKAFEYAMLFKRLDGIVGAGWREAAFGGSEHGR